MTTDKSPSRKLSAAPFVMPEAAWIRLCLAQCQARRRKYPDDDCERDGLCSECVVDACERVPDRYRTTTARALEHDALPGIDERHLSPAQRPAKRRRTSKSAKPLIPEETAPMMTTDNRSSREQSVAARATGDRT